LTTLPDISADAHPHFTQSNIRTLPVAPDTGIGLFTIQLLLKSTLSKVHNTGPYKPRTGHTGHTGRTGVKIQLAPGVSCMNYCCPFHLCSLLGMVSRYTVLEVRRPMRVCCGSRWGWCMLFPDILDSLTAPCLVYNTAMYTVYGRCGQYGGCMVHTLAGAAGAWFIWTPQYC